MIVIFFFQLFSGSLMMFCVWALLLSLRVFVKRQEQTRVETVWAQPSHRIFWKIPSDYVKWKSLKINHGKIFSLSCHQRPLWWWQMSFVVFLDICGTAAGQLIINVITADCGLIMILNVNITMVSFSLSASLPISAGRYRKRNLYVKFRSVTAFVV